MKLRKMFFRQKNGSTFSLFFHPISPLTEFIFLLTFFLQLPNTQKEKKIFSEESFPVIKRTLKELNFLFPVRPFLQYTVWYKSIRKQERRREKREKMSESHEKKAVSVIVESKEWYLAAYAQLIKAFQPPII